MPSQRTYHVYIMSNVSKTLCVGVTSGLERRVWEHRQNHSKGFTQRYNITMLVHIESFPWVDDAIAREKQLKGWNRDKKLALIRESNPDWLDLAADWIK
jgi:putative endonuclease